MVFYRNTTIPLQKFGRIYEKLYCGDFPKLKSLRLAFGSTMLIANPLETIILSERMCFLKDFGFFWDNPVVYARTAKNMATSISKFMVKMESLHFFLQTNFVFYTAEEMDEILSVLFLTKSHKLRFLSLGFCSDQETSHFATSFNLNHFGKLLKENEWSLLKFHLYFEVNAGVKKEEIKKY